VQQLSKIWLHNALQLSVVFDDAARVSQTCAVPKLPICFAVWPDEKVIWFAVTVLHAVCASAQVNNAPPWLHCCANAPDASERIATTVVMVNCMVVKDL